MFQNISSQSFPAQLDEVRTAALHLQNHPSANSKSAPPEQGLPLPTPTPSPPPPSPSPSLLSKKIKFLKRVYRAAPIRNATFAEKNKKSVAIYKNYLGKIKYIFFFK